MQRVTERVAEDVLERRLHAAVALHELGRDARPSYKALCAARHVRRQSVVPQRRNATHPVARPVATQLASESQPNGLLVGEIDLIEADEDQPIPDEHRP